MINGAHVLIYSSNPEADRAFFRDVLGFPWVDVGHGWLIFALPASEAAVHPADVEGGTSHAGHALLNSVLYFMCDDLRATMRALADKNVSCTAIGEERWGIKTTIKLPSGGEIGLYEPKHLTALNLR